MFWLAAEGEGIWLLCPPIDPCVEMEPFDCIILGGFTCSAVSICLVLLLSAGPIVCPLLTLVAVMLCLVGIETRLPCIRSPVDWPWRAWAPPGPAEPPLMFFMVIEVGCWTDGVP